MNAQLREFFKVAFAFVYGQLKGQASMDAVAAAARSVLEEMTKAGGQIRWETAARATVSSLKKKSALHRPVRVVAFVTEAADTELVPVQMDDGTSEEVETTQATIQDRRRDSILTMDILGLGNVEMIQQAAKGGGPVELLGVPLALPTSFNSKTGQPLQVRRSFFFQVVDVRSSYSHLDLIGATDQEREVAHLTLQEWRRDRMAPLEVIRDMTIDGLGILGTRDFSLLTELVEFTVLQALSCGSITHAPARLHMLLVGPPGHGKKLIGVAAKVLNPTFAELSAAKVSPPGLIGASSASAGCWRSQPGALARAAHGVAVLQDAHAWKARELEKIGPILQEVIEDGVVRDTVAGGSTRNAPVALLIDLNRTSQVGLQGNQPEAAILRLRPLLSRVDVIAEINKDVDRAWRVAGEMYKGLRSSKDHAGGGESWKREVQVIVAALRDEHPEVDLAPVQGLMKKSHDEIWNANKDLLEYMPEAGDIPIRQAISFGRLVIAYARGADRSVATPEDVERAKKYINMKLAFLRMHGASMRAPEQPAGPGQERKQWVRQHAQKPISPEDLAVQYTQDTGNAVDEKTIRRDLKELGAKKQARGKWYVPQALGTKGQKDNDASDIWTSSLIAPGVPNERTVVVPGLKHSIRESPGFKKKLLAEYKLDLLGLCGFGCRYCSSNWGNYLRINRERFAEMSECQLRHRYYPDQEPGLTFRWTHVLRSLEEQLAAAGADFGRDQTVVVSMLTDAFSPQLVADGTVRRALDLLVLRSSFRIRVLTKNGVVGTPEWLDFFCKHPGRFVVGLSIGTLDDGWSKGAELGTSPPTTRLQALKNLQDTGVPTFGMLCPVFPDMLDAGRLEELVDKINPTSVEHLWAEPYNDRTNWERVRDTYKIGSAGYEWFNQAFVKGGDKAIWSTYATKLYVRLRKKAEAEGWLPKLRYLLYEDGIVAADAHRFGGLTGVLLQSKPGPDGRSANPSVAELQRQSEHLES